MTRYFDLYNARRRNSALDRRTPDAVYFAQEPVKLAAGNPSEISLTRLSRFAGPFLIVGDYNVQSIWTDITDRVVQRVSVSIYASIEPDRVTLET